MDSRTPFSTEFEQEVRAAMAVPEADPEFLASLKKQLLAKSPSQTAYSPKSSYHRQVWRGALSVLTLIALLTLVIAIVLVSVPGAANAMKRLFGYIPEVGLVEQGTPIRVLAAPVSVTREGISVTVTAALLANDRTHVDYRIFGVPGSAYPNREDLMGCMDSPYLRLPDGSQLTITNADFPPVPTGVNEAIFVLPCILDTLPGKAPTDWELPIKFIPAPPDLTVMSVVDLPTQQQPTLAPVASDQSNPNPPESTQPPMVDAPVKALKEIETPDGYILAIQIPPNGTPGNHVQREIRDANGKKVSFSTTTDIHPDQLGLDPAGFYWFVQFKAAGLAYPLSITLSGNTIKQAEPGATAEFTFDAGSNPQMGQEWNPEQEIHLAGYTLRLLAIRADSRNGYSFTFEGDPDLVTADLEILGYTATGWGGGSGIDGMFEKHLSYGEYPTGLLTVKISNLIVTGDPLTWEGKWSPANPRTDLLANSTPQPGLCLDASGLDNLAQAPENLAQGKALVYEKLEGSDQWGLVLYHLDSGQKQVVAADSAWGALSPDGSQVAYSPFSQTAVDVRILDLNSQSVRTLPGVSGVIYWSPDGVQIAYVAQDSIYISNADGSQYHRGPDLSYGSIAGWSADGKQLNYVIPYTGGAAWKVYAFDLANGVPKELFTIENGTPKFLDPKISPDGQWIAYRGRDSSSLYLVRTDGSDMHLVLDNLGVAGMEWTPSGWLGMSLMQADSYHQTLLLVNPDTCEAYRLMEVGGEMEGLFVP